MALPLGDPHVLWGWWTLWVGGQTHLPDVGGACDQVRESSRDKQSTPLNSAFLQEQLGFKSIVSLFLLSVYSEPLRHGPAWWSWLSR